MEAEEGALEAAGADGDTEKRQYVLFRQVINILKCFVCKLLAEHRHGSLGNGAAGAAPVEGLDAAAS